MKNLFTIVQHRQKSRLFCLVSYQTILRKAVSANSGTFLKPHDLVSNTICPWVFDLYDRITYPLFIHGVIRSGKAELKQLFRWRGSHRPLNFQWCPLRPSRPDQYIRPAPRSRSGFGTRFDTLDITRHDSRYDLTPNRMGYRVGEKFDTL